MSLVGKYTILSNATLTFTNIFVKFQIWFRKWWWWWYKITKWSSSICCSLTLMSRVAWVLDFKKDCNNKTTQFCLEEKVCYSSGKLLLFFLCSRRVNFESTGSIAQLLQLVHVECIFIAEDNVSNWLSAFVIPLFSWHLVMRKRVVEF